MICPNCKLLVPDMAERCDCGYDFASQSVKRTYLTGDLAAEHVGPSLTVGDKLWGQTALEGNRAEVIKKTYLLLTLAVTAGIAGGMVGANSTAMVELFSGWMGWILAMVVLNVVPRIAIAVRHHPLLGVTALVGDGFVAGLVLAPVLHLASVVSPDIVQGAMILTAIVFCAVTFVRHDDAENLLCATCPDDRDLLQHHRRADPEWFPTDWTLRHAHRRSHRDFRRFHTGLCHQRRPE